MKISNWLTINSKGTARLTKNKPRQEYDEVTMLLKVELPNSVFQRPQITANIKIDGEMNYEFDYQLNADIKNVLETLPNIHLLSVEVNKKNDEEQKEE